MENGPIILAFALAGHHRKPINATISIIYRASTVASCGIASKAHAGAGEKALKIIAMCGFHGCTLIVIGPSLIALDL
jgi:hypothetical protein